jgi:hypothetical protein
MVDVFVLNVDYVLLGYEWIYFPEKFIQIKGNYFNAKHTFRVLATFRVSLIDVEAMSCLCNNVAVDIGVVASSNAYGCLSKKNENKFPVFYLFIYSYIIRVFCRLGAKGGLRNVGI